MNAVSELRARAGAPSAVERHARLTPGYGERVAATLERLRAAAAAHAPSIVLATSLGAEDMALTDLIARHRLPITLAMLDTGELHAETLALLPRAEVHYGLSIERWSAPAEQVVAFVRRHGERSMYESIEQRKACCALRKLEPLARLLEGRSAWVTGLRRAQSVARADVPFEQLEPGAAGTAGAAGGRVKFNPLADWSDADVWHYIGEHAVPYNPLHDRFFPSIGCAPCTRAVTLGEDPRSGRWWWEQAGPRECGLHVAEDSASAIQPGFAPDEPVKA